MKKNNIHNKTIRTDQKFSVSMVMIAIVGILANGLTADIKSGMGAQG